MLKKLGNNLAYILIGLLLAIAGVVFAANVSVPQSPSKGAYLSGLASGNYQVTAACSNGQILAASSTAASGWACVANSGGGGTPGGSNTDVQFNNSGSFGGNSGFTYDGSSNLSIGQGSTNGGILGPNNPTTIAAASLAFYTIGTNPLSYGGVNYDGSAQLMGTVSTSTTAGGSVVISGGDNIAAAANGGSVILAPGVGSSTSTDGTTLMVAPTTGFAAIFNPGYLTANHIFIFPNVTGNFAIASTSAAGLFQSFTNNTFSLGSSTPIAKLTVVGNSGSTTPIFVAASSSGTSFLQVASNGSTTLSSLGAGCVNSTSGGSLFTAACASGGSGSISTSTNAQIGKVAIWTGLATLGNGALLDNGTVAGINATSSTSNFNIQGTGSLNALSVASSSGTSMLNVDSTGKTTIGPILSTLNSYIQYPTTAARNDVTINIGYVFQPTQPITITQMGRLYVAGNSQNHVAYIWDTNGGTLIASTTILAASASDANNFKWATITPTTLVTSDSYVVSTQETLGGDTWKDDWNATGYFSTVLSNIVDRYSPGVGAYPGSTSNNPNYSYGTVAFKYSPVISAVTVSVGSNNASTSYSFIAVNSDGSGLLAARNDGAVGIGGLPTGTSKLYINGNIGFSAQNTTLTIPNVTLGNGNSMSLIAGSASVAGGQVGGDVVLQGGDGYTGGATDRSGNIRLIGGSDTFNNAIDAGDIIFSSRGAKGELMRIVGSSDTVGIGTSTPVATLSLQGTSGTNLLDIASSTGSSLVRITQSGNVGIGTTTPSQPLVVVGSSTITSLVAGFVCSTATGQLYNGCTNVSLGKVTTYNGLTTQGQGLSPIVMENDITATTTAVTIGSFTPTATTTLEAAGYLDVTAIATDVLNFRLTWTDENGTSQTQNFVGMGLTSGSVSSTGYNAYSSATFRAAANQPVTLAIVFTTGIGSVTYDTGGWFKVIK